MTTFTVEKPPKEPDIEESVRRGFPWAQPLRDSLQALLPPIYRGQNLLLGSDYSGTHAASHYLTYCFLSLDAEASCNWPAAARRWRGYFLPDKRTLSFKKLNDRLRARALGPYLGTLNYIHGHLSAFVVTKKLRHLSSNPLAFEKWRNIHGLKSGWKPSAFEELSRITHLFALLVAEFSQPFQHVTWITDDDQIVANDDRLSDALSLASSYTTLHCQHRLGELAINTSSFEDFVGFEDIVAAPDLAAGAVSELVNCPNLADRDFDLSGGALSMKTRVILSYLMAEQFTPRFAVFIIDGDRSNGFRLRKIQWEA